uniref:Pathogenesis-related genes transcriptional activator n=1 Tax=Tetraselmis sp. GSL018 TaxID=582737 RepID=A0A061REF3_9CHLO
MSGVTASQLQPLSVPGPDSPTRSLDPGEQTGNAPKSSSKYKGVHWDKTKSKWVGYIHMKGKKHHLGYFPSEEEAARAYDRESLRCRGYSKNFPRSEYPAKELAAEPETRKTLEKSSRYTGVSWNKLRRKWAARIIIDGRSQHLGHFTNESDAARAYDKVSYQSRGCTKNFPLEDYVDFFEQEKVATSLLLPASPQSSGKTEAQKLPSPGLLLQQQQQAAFQAAQGHLGVHNSHLYFADSVRARSHQEGSQDSAASCDDALKHPSVDLQYRLTLPTDRSQAVPPVSFQLSAAELSAMLSAGQCPAGAQLTSQAGFGTYSPFACAPAVMQATVPGQAAIPPLQPQALSQPSAASQAPPPHLMSYGAALPGLAGLLPISAVKPQQPQQSAGQSLGGHAASFFMPHMVQASHISAGLSSAPPRPQTTPELHAAQHGASTLLAAQSGLLQLPGVLQQAPGFAPSSHHMAQQLQALVLQNYNSAMMAQPIPASFPPAPALVAPASAAQHSPAITVAPVAIKDAGAADPVGLPAAT